MNHSKNFHKFKQLSFGQLRKNEEETLMGNASCLRYFNAKNSDCMAWGRELVGEDNLIPSFCVAWRGKMV